MIWLTSFSLIFFLQSPNGGVEASPKYAENSPWTNPTTAGKFIDCLTEGISTSPVFPQQEKEDMQFIVETMMSAMSRISSHRGNRAQLQALNMAFASSLAELVIAEDIGNSQAINIKTEALTKCLGSCFRSTLGVVNNRFINEIKDLIKVFADEANAPEDNEIDIGGSSLGTINNEAGNFFAGAGQSSASYGAESTAYSQSSTGAKTTTTTTNKSETKFSTASSGAASAGYSAAAGYGAAFGAGGYSTYIGNLASGLLGYGGFQALFGAGIDLSARSRIVNTCLSRAFDSLNVDSNLSASITSSIMSGLSSGGAASANGLANLIANGVVGGLGNAGFLNANNAYGFVSSFASSFSQAAAAASASSASQSTSSSSASSSSTSSSSASSGAASADYVAAEGFGVSGSFVSGGYGDGGLHWISSSGLTSPQARNRIQRLISELSQSFDSVNSGVSAVSRGILSSFSEAKASGLSESDAKSEALFEAIVALIQIINSTNSGLIDFSSTGVISNYFVESLKDKLCLFNGTGHGGLLSGLLV